MKHPKLGREKPGKQRLLAIVRRGQSQQASKIVDMGRPRKAVTPEQAIDQLALRIRDKLFASWSQNVENFVSRLDSIMDEADQPQRKAVPVPARARELPPTQSVQPTPGKAKRGSYSCRACREPGHRKGSDKCPLTAGAAKPSKSDPDDEEPDSEPQPRSRPGPGASLGVFTDEPRAVPFKRIEWDEQRRLIGLVQTNNDSRALDQMVKANIGLVHRVARKCTWSNQPYEDMVQEGTIGLIKGIQKFDLSKPFKLSTYATYWIWHHIVRSHENNDLIRLPARYGHILTKLAKAQLKLEGELGRQPTEFELAARIKASPSDVHRMMERGRVSTSLDQILDDSGESSLHSILASNTEDPEMLMERNQAALTISEALSKLPSREAAIIRMRYLDGDGMTLKEVGDMIGTQSGSRIGVSRERVRQMETVALKSLRHQLRRAS